MTGDETPPDRRSTCGIRPHAPLTAAQAEALRRLMGQQWPDPDVIRDDLTRGA